MSISKMHQTKIKFISTYRYKLRTEQSDSHAVKFIKKTAFVLSLFLAISCTKSDPNFKPIIVTEFGTIVELEGEHLFEDVLGKASFTLIDSLILFSTRDEDMFQVYDLDENHISSFGRQGRGPGEYTRQPYFRDANSFIKNGNDHILFYDESNNMTGVELDVTASIQENEVVIAKEFKLPEIFSHPYISLFHINSETYLGMYGDQVFQQIDGREGGWYYSPADTSVTTFSMYNLHMEPFDAIPERNLNIRYLGVSPDRSKFATAFLFAPVIEIFDMYATEPLQIQVTDKPFPPTAPFTPDVFNENRLTEYFWFIYTSNEYIYLLYTGKKMSEPNKEQFVKIIDWEGNPVQQYSIPIEYNIDLFQVDVENNQLYGLSWDNDAIYRFDL